MADCEKFFLEGTTPNLPGIFVGGRVEDKRYKLICQKYKDIYRFATLYDTTNRIPVFSAYTFTGNTTGRPSQSWMIEPQLDDINGQGEMKQSERRSFKHQAMNADYKYNNLSLDRGHLFPCSYAPDNATKNSTFTLTNAVPQASSFNRRSWRKMECRVRKFLVKNCKDNNNKIKAYLVTGAVPSNNKLKKRVNIPDLLWTAFCCFNNKKKEWMARAHWSKNVPDTKGKTLKPITLQALEHKLKNIYNDKVNVFTKKCPRTYPILSVLEDETGRDLESVEEDETGRDLESVEEDETGEKRSGEPSIKMVKATGECDEEDGCDCDCDEK
ncbi:endonuclease domain-containing 1 protein-like [Salvelinus fontinalis]|uniref:endonuclease domain-containing 1 protein-like n=1 Tax=Salvelinus fontinalis TaxID=8038 RepID=UPI00248689D5|nr:endonuclease domain-containing 1 protein-like [Salvelinus fontinalis]